MPLLQQFVCAEPPPRRLPPRHRRALRITWQHEVQSGIRALRPPLGAEELLLLGFDDEGLAAVGWSCEQGGPETVKVIACARALRCRGLGYGELVMTELLGRLAERLDAAGLRRGVVVGLVHAENQESQQLAARMRFFHHPDAEGDYREWWTVIELQDD